MPLYARPHRSAGRQHAGPVGRLADLAILFHARHSTCQRIDELVTLLRRSGVWAVAGEAELLVDLRDLVTAAGDLLREEEPDLEAIEARLRDVAWDVAEEVASDLRNKLARDREMGTWYAELISERRDQVTALQGRLRDARSAQAPVRREEAAVRRLDGMVTQVERLIREGNYIEADRRVHELTEPNEMIAAEHMASDIATRVTEARRFSRQADLMLLRAPDGGTRLRYTILLRTPSEPGTVGVNIEAASCLSEADSKRLRAAMKQVTDGINAGLARSFATANPGPTRTLSTGAPIGPPPAPPMPLNELLKSAGDLLYRLVIPEQVYSFLTPNCSLTITTNDLELPWELMVADGEPLCTRQPVARMPMGRALPRARQLRDGGGKVRFLLVHSDPEKTLSKAGQEVAEIEARLKADLGDRIEVIRLEPAQASGDQLNDALRGGRFDVIHYAGHAAFDKDDGDLSGLLLHEREVFFAQKIRRLVEGRPLVFLNACESGLTANETQPQQVGRYLQLPAEGLASAFIYGGAVGCIGSIWPVYDGPAAAFAVAFYTAVLDGYPLGEAMRRAREQNRKDHPNQVTWATFVLYGDPRYRLVD